MRLLKAARSVLKARSGLGSVGPPVGVSFVGTTFAEVLTGRALAVRVWKYTVRRILFPLCVLAPFAYFFPRIALFYAVCGAYDVGRNSGLNLSTLRRYFIGNGFPTWVLSPFNILLDLLSLPYVNKGVYRLGDLPPAYQDEVKRLIQAARDANLVMQLEEAAKKYPRTMVFLHHGAGYIGNGMSTTTRQFYARIATRIISSPCELLPTIQS